MTELVRHYDEVTVGEVIHSHGVPFVIDRAATPTTHGATWMSGIYRGPDLGTYDDGNPLAPFVRRDGDQWTFQRRADIALVKSYDGGATWHQVT